MRSAKDGESPRGDGEPRRGKVGKPQKVTVVKLESQVEVKKNDWRVGECV